MRAFVGLGANLGDRAAALRGALAALRRLSGTRVTGVSSLYETEPVGFADQPLFYNAAVELDTELGPGELLERMQEIEAAAGRRREGPRFGPRELDLDLLLYGDAVLTEGELELPHPRLAQRSFVLVPLAELSPNLVLPDGRPLRQVLADLGEVRGVRRRGFLEGLDEGDLPRGEVDRVARRGLAEDAGRGDLTTRLLVPAEQLAKAAVVAREPGVVAGLAVAREVFRRADPELVCTACRRDGEAVAAGEALLRLTGRARGILIGERVALNFLQRLSGIATDTERAVNLLLGTPARVADTRKTTPGLRLLEKHAVRAGGCVNHRFALDNLVLIKDNHLLLAGGVRRAVERARRGAPFAVRVEVEVETPRQAQEAVAAGADLILLDNMSPADLREAVRRVAGRCPLEASGGVSWDNLAEIGRTGVDFVSMGALTHSVRALDLSLEVEL